MTPPPLLSNHAEHDKFAKQIVSAAMPKHDKRGGGVTLVFFLSNHTEYGTFANQITLPLAYLPKGESYDSQTGGRVISRELRNMKKEVVR